ncbi:MAG TPA: hypothetical protein VND93_01230, partial [Myxococcales bacterium]|nr:hypothetical protein [Myxococcales bacterium]
MFTASSTAASKPAAAPKVETPKPQSQSQSKPASAPITTPKATPAAYHQDSFQPATGASLKTAPKTTGTGPVASTNQAGGTPPTIDDVVTALKDGKKDDATRTMIHDFFAPLNMADSKAAMDRIRSEGLVDQFIDAAARDANDKPVDPQVKDALKQVFNSGRLDVYAETISNTSITVGNY